MSNLLVLLVCCLLSPFYISHHNSAQHVTMTIPPPAPGQITLTCNYFTGNQKEGGHGAVISVESVTKFITFEMAMLTSTTSFRNHLIFGKLYFTVTPFLSNSMCFAGSTLSGIKIKLQSFENP